MSPLSRKNRRAVLLMLYRAVKERFRELTLCQMYHSDEPLNTTLSTMLRGIVGNDALGRRNASQEFGYLIRILRTKAGLSQKEFAKTCGLSQAYVSLIEHGKKSPSPRLILFLDSLLISKQPSHENSPQIEARVSGQMHSNHAPQAFH